MLENLLEYCTWSIIHKKNVRLLDRETGVAQVYILTILKFTPAVYPPFVLINEFVWSALRCPWYLTNVFIIFCLCKFSGIHGPILKRSAKLVQPFGQLDIANIYIKTNVFLKNIVFEKTTVFKNDIFLF